MLKIISDKEYLHIYYFNEYYCSFDTITNKMFNAKQEQCLIYAFE